MNPKIIDINCDLGESILQQDWDNDALLMPYISSANIACGGHAGNTESMRVTIANSKKHQLKIGAHPSFPDKENFGRKELAITPNDLRKSLSQQLNEFQTACKEQGCVVHHVKPHGALYNLAAKDLQLAKLIAEEVAALSPSIKLMGLAQSEMKFAAQLTGIEFINEGFMDRLYHQDASLVSRDHPQAVHKEIAQCLDQALSIAQKQPIQSLEKAVINIQAESICLHGDHENAVEIAKALHSHLKQNNISIQ